MREDRYLLEEISELSGVEIRTIYHWMSRGLLKGPGRMGPGTRYPENFLHRVKFIQKLRERQVPLELIGETLESLPDDQIERVASGKEEVRVLPLSVVQRQASFLRDADAMASPRARRSLSSWAMSRENAPRAEEPPRREADEIIEALRDLLAAARRHKAGDSARWATGQAGEDLLLLVRGLDAKGEFELMGLARRLGELLSRGPGRDPK